MVQRANRGRLFRIHTNFVSKILMRKTRTRFMYDKISLKADFYDRFLSSKSKNYGIELMKSLQWPAGFVESVEGPVDRLLYSSKNGEKT